MSASLAETNPSGNSTPETAYEDYPPEFHKWLNDKLGDVVVGDGVYEASEVLFKVDKTAYLSYFEEFQITPAEEDLLSTPEYLSLRRRVCDHYPPLIAYCFNRTIDAWTHQVRLGTLRDVWESAIYFLHAVVVAEYRARRLKFGDAGLTLPRLFTDSLNHRIDNIRKLLNSARTRGDDLCSDDLIPGDVLDALEELNRDVRNEVAHVQSLSEWQAKNRFEEVLPRVKDILLSLRGLEGMGVRRLLGNKGDVFHLTFEEFYGQSLQPRNRLIEFTIDRLRDWGFVLRDTCTLTETQNKLWNLSPFIYVSREGRGQHPELWFFKQKRNELDPANLRSCELRFEVMGSSRQETLSAERFRDDIVDLHTLCQ